MEKCAFCKIEKHEDDFYMYSIHRMTRGRVQKGYVCKNCSDRSYGTQWNTISGYDQKCEISNMGHVRELRDNRYYDITTIQNASVSYVYLSKNGKSMKKNINSLMKRFASKNE